MAWEKSPPELLETFEAVLPASDRVERRKMFGYPNAFVQGNMFVALHERNLIVRLSEEKREELLKLSGAKKFEPMAGRVMQEYVAITPVMQKDLEKLKEWVVSNIKQLHEVNIRLWPAAALRRIVFSAV